MDLNKLLEFAKQNAISLEINFLEASNEFEIRTSSPVPSECFYMKRCSNVDYFIQKWEENLDTKLKTKLK